MVTTTTKEEVQARWAACRESVALGLSVREAAEKHGLPYAGARKRAEKEGWPTKTRLIAEARKIAPLEAVAQSWQERGEQHRRTVMSLVERALGAANLPPPENWADLERAARIGDRAAGLEKQAPTIQLAFPIATSTEVLPFHDALSDFAGSLPHLTPSPSDP
jgi:hypothetical protein